MIYDIVLPAVIRKSQTVPPDTIIGNTEMVACVGYVYSDYGIKEIPEFDSPDELYNKFIKDVDEFDTSKLSDTSVNMINMVKQYQVIPMKNETMDDLKVIIKLSMS